jgi:hypothetical protein
LRQAPYLVSRACSVTRTVLHGAMVLLISRTPSLFTVAVSFRLPHTVFRSGCVCFRVGGSCHVARNILGRAPRLNLLQRSDDLRLRVPALAHRLSPFLRPNRIPKWTDSGGQVKSAAYRASWLRYAANWVRSADPNGFLEMPGSRTIRSPIDHRSWYSANLPSPAVPDGLGDEVAIRSIWTPA